MSVTNQPAAETARRAGDAARGWWLAALCAAALAGGLPGGLPGQAPAADQPLLRLFAADAARLGATAAEPAVRGEAALVLAATGDDRHYETVLAVARDPQPAARLRGILALGYLGTPGSELVLEEILAASRTRPQPDGIVAAFALGLLPEDVAPAAVTRYLVRFLQSSFKRQRDVLLAMLAALAGRDAPAQREALHQLFDDAANRDPAVRGALLQVLGRIPDGITPERAATVLRRGSTAERGAVLRWLASQEEPPKELLPLLTDMVAHDGDGGVRAGALAVLTRLRHLPALDLAARAIRSPDALEVAQGTRTALLLGGSAMRAAIERGFSTLPVQNQIAVMQQLGGAMSEAFQLSTLELAADRRQPLTLRIASALALARAEVTEVAPALRALFLDARGFTDLTEIAHALQRLEAVAPELARLHCGARADELALDSERVAALLCAGHPEIARFCLDQLRHAATDAVASTSLLRAIRRAELPAAPGAQQLPAPLDELLR
jgi:hypothetical protein